MESDFEGRSDDRTKALEEQVKLLQKENDLLKSMPKDLQSKVDQLNSRPTSARMDNSYSIKSFREDEQIQELKAQLKSRQDEVNKLQETLKTRTKPDEYEEKTKRMRGIFAQASKSLDEYRAIIAGQTEQISSLEETLSTTEQKLSQVQAELNTTKDTAEHLDSETRVREAQYNSKIAELEMKLRQCTTQLAHNTTEFQQYKQRANALLEQMSPNDNSDGPKLTTLETELGQLKLEKTELLNESSTASKRIKVLEQDLRQTLETVEQLQQEKKNSIKFERQRDALRKEIEQLKQSFVDEKLQLERVWEKKLQDQNEALTTLKAQTENLSQNTDDRVLEKEEENKIMKESNASLHDEITGLKAEVKSLEDTIKQMQNEITTVAQNKADSISGGNRIGSPDSRNQTQISSPTPSSGSVYASLSNLLSPSQLFGNETSGGISPVGESVSSSQNNLQMKEKEYQQQLKYLAEMLNESETAVAALRAQEKTLKEEIRKMDAFDRRQNLNIEYLKNVFFKYLKSENKQTMVPILSKLLSLDAKETQELELQSSGGTASKNGSVSILSFARHA